MAGVRNCEPFEDVHGLVRISEQVSRHCSPIA